MYLTNRKRYDTITMQVHHKFVEVCSELVTLIVTRDSFKFTMNSNDLFSFLEEETVQDEQDAMVVDQPTHKRKADQPLDDSLPNDPGPSSPKRPRMASPAPVVLDDFETEAKREVAASAGLTGAVEAGSRLELKHQVRTNLA